MRLLPALLVCLSVASAEERNTDPGLRHAVEGYLDEVVVTATRSPAVALDTPYSAESISADEIRRRSYRTLPQALSNRPGVMVQETAVGHGSPYIRGFTSFRNLFLVDGIRLNNSVFRPGPNQYWNTVDPLSLDRIELVKGPSSVLYGSDAIGGTVNAITVSPYDLESVGGSVLYRGATAENSHTARGEISAGWRGATALIAGLGFKHFGDLIAGDPTGRQPNTGYDEWAGDFKLVHLFDPDTRVVLAYQHVRQNNVPRTHRTVFAVPFHGTTVGSELQRDLDQERRLLYVQFHKTDIGGAVDAVRASLSWHVQKETRDRIRPPARRDLQGFDVGTLGFWIQLESPSPVGRLTYGLEYYHDEVDSFSSSNPVQGPVGDDATYDLLGVFVQDILEAGERWQLILGIRFNHAAADAKRVSDPVGGGAIRIEDDWSAVVGSVRVRYDLVPKRWNLFGGVSQGFRAPNLSDLTRFDSARTNEFEIPSPGLDPEHYTAFEVGLKGQTPEFHVQASVFYTDIRDRIARVPTGATTPDGEAVVTKANVGDGWVWGVELGSAWRFASDWTLFGNLAWIEGRADTFPTSAPVAVREYLDRLMPFTVQLGVRWEHDGVWVELLGIAADKADRLSTRDMGDTSRIPPGGTPGYAVLHLRGGWRATDRITLRAGIENVLDKSYRVHGSGQNMAGLNFVFSASVDF